MLSFFVVDVFLVCVVLWCQCVTATLKEKPLRESDCVNVKTVF